MEATASTAATAGAAALSRRRELLDFLCDRRDDTGAGESPLASSVRGDVDCALRGDERDERERDEISRARGDLLSRPCDDDPDSESALAGLSAVLAEAASRVDAARPDVRCTEFALAAAVAAAADMRGAPGRCSLTN